MKAMVITDNRFIYEKFISITKNKADSGVTFDFFCTHNNHIFQNELSLKKINCINVKADYRSIIDNYDIVFSLHCKQIFPSELIQSVRCINVHPGLNPYNRGWYPQVFHIINKLPIGVTIHEMDTELDHGSIIAQREIKVHSWETSKDAYEKLQNTEAELLEIWLQDILDHKYATTTSCTEGNINYRKDFEKLCKIDLNKKGTYADLIDELRALTFDGYNNAYFMDEQNNKVYVSIKLHT